MSCPDNGQAYPDFFSTNQRHLNDWSKDACVIGANHSSMEKNNSNMYTILSEKCLNELNKLSSDESLNPESSLKDLGAIVHQMSRHARDHIEKEECRCGLPLEKDHNEQCQVASAVPANVFMEKYQEKYTQIFGEQLNAFRQEETFTDTDLPLLIDCIETSWHSLTDSEKLVYSP